MQKVILLPRMPDIKETFFLSRLIVFNQTFASLKKNDSHYLIIWHEDIAARNAEDVTSAFLSFFLKNRDFQKLIIWMDNCAGQNKNWVLYSSVINYLNSGLATTHEIYFKYLVKGHTFMAADGIHGRIEQKMRKTKNIYDIDDFIQVCEAAAKRNKIVKMNTNDFMDLKTIIRPRKPKDKEDTLPYLKDVVEVKFVKGSHEFCYKTDFNKPFIQTENIIKKKMEVGKFPEKRIVPRGILATKKKGIVDSLVPKMPDSRRNFWLQMPESMVSEDLIENCI